MKTVVSEEFGTMWLALQGVIDFDDLQEKAGKNQMQVMERNGGWWLVRGLVDTAEQFDANRERSGPYDYPWPAWRAAHRALTGEL